LKAELTPVIELEDKKSRLEKFLSYQDHRPNKLTHSIWNALGWNVVFVKSEFKPDKKLWERSQVLGGGQMYVDPIFEKQVELHNLQKDHPGAKLTDILKKLWKPKWIPAMNSITNDGEIGYANQAAEEVPAANEDFFTTTTISIPLRDTYLDPFIS